MVALPLLLLVLVNVTTNVSAWLPAKTSTRQSLSLLRESTTTSGSGNSNNVDTIRLEGLGDDHGAVAEALGASVQRWLDAEWMPQEIHTQIGDSCGRSYIVCRRDRRTDDIMTIMTQVADDLTEVWNEKYDQDAFVNAWDVANYVSDYLTKQAGNESCECSANIH